MENAFDLLPPKSKPQKLEADDLVAASRQLTRAIEQAQMQIGGLESAVASRTDLGSEGGPKRQGLAELKKKTRAIASEANRIEQQIRKELAKEEMRTTFKYLSANQLPEVEDVKFEQADINLANQAILDRAGEKELDPILRRIPEADLQRAIETAEGNARRFEGAGKPVGKSLDQIDQLVEEQIALAAAFHRSLRACQNSVGDGPPGPVAKNSADPLSVRDSLDKSDAAVQAAAEELDQLVKAGRYSYNARRQRRESDYHLKTAGLYEVQVHLNGFTSDRHRTRSKLFFFGMLAAQAGVTIASLSLAVHKRNVLWALAGLAGIAAVMFSGYVYLWM